MPKRAKQEPKFRSTLSQDQKKSLFFAAVSDAEVCSLLSSSSLAVEHFQELDLYLWYIWEVTENFFKRHHRVPAVRELQLGLGQRADAPDDPLPDSTVDEIADFLEEFVRNGESQVIGQDTARTYLHDFMADMVWRQTQQLTSVRGRTPESIRSTLETLNRDLTRIESLSEEGIEPAFYDGYEKDMAKIEPSPYGLPFMDALLGGGGAPGETYIVLAPYGGGKTTLLEQLSLNQALLQLARWLHSNRRQSLGISYFVSYEMQREVIIYRALAHVAQVPFTVLMKQTPLSARGKLSPRDYELFHRQYEHGLYIPSEQERKLSAEQRLRQNWKLLDFSGFDPRNPLAGGGKCEEIMHRIDADLRNAVKRGLKRHVAGIFIDYIGMMARRYCIVNNKNLATDFTPVCNSAADDARRYLAKHFRCPVFLSHQLNAQANKLKPGQVADRTDSAGAKTVAENCDFIFVGSLPTEEQNLLRLSCQKRRRMKGLGPIVLQLQGEFAQLVEVSSLYSWDEITRQFTQLTTVDPRDTLIESETADEDGYIRKRPYRFDGQSHSLFDLL
jgi:hypothetical protein